MKYTVEDDLSNFKFWSGARYFADKLTDDDFDTIESQIGDILGDDVTDTAINDLFWFDHDSIAVMLGYDDEEDMERKRSGKDDEEEDEDE